ncbi:MAG: GAF domain-containing protein [Pleurocapsa minor GSE-CHR-MK-17-07R]|jgi:GAF domain-containing protein/HAMP domain-containing protein|nr:GAF domain-containing protein [Pleurocapsa minor GSE-CHR-MK 17-07R]
MLRLLNLNNYPIWFKLVIVLTFGMVMLLIPATSLLRSAIEDVSVQNASSIVAQAGAQQAAVIAGNVQQSAASLDSFVSNVTNVRVLQSLLIGGVRTDIDIDLPTVRDDDVEALLSRSLLNPATSLFETVRLVNRRGDVLARSDLSTSIGLSTGDEADSPTFRAAEANALNGQLRTLAVSEIYGIGIIEQAVAIPWRDGRVLGYLIGRISNSRTIYPALQFPRADYEGISYLQSGQGDILSPTEMRMRTNALDAAALVNLALAGGTGTQEYDVDGVPLIGYYTAVRGTPLALITQIPESAALSQAAGIFNVRNFVVILGGAIVVLAVALLVQLLLAPALGRLRRAADAISAGNLNEPMPEVDRQDEIGRLAGSVETMRSTMTALINDLENRVATRTRDIQATQDISRYASAERDLDRLMSRVVDLIIDRFPSIYHAQIFLLDGDRQYAVVRASTGAVGQQLLARGHRLAVGSISVIGQVTEQGRLILARDTAASQVHRRNEFLPDTRAELAIPLMLGDEIIGALDVQSKAPDIFTQDLIDVLQTMSEQIAIAIQNARLYEENSRRSLELEATNRAATRRAWSEFMRDQRRPMLEKGAGFDALLSDGETRSADTTVLRARAMAELRAVAGDMTSRNTIPIAVPVVLRGETLGVVEWELPSAGFGAEKLELAQELANRLAVSLENARLFAESRRATERERTVNTIASRLTTQSTIDDILRTAVREVGQALGAPQVTIRLQAQPNEADAPAQVITPVMRDAAPSETTEPATQDDSTVTA